MRCPHCDEPLPPSPQHTGHNGGDTITLSIPLAALSAVSHALAIGRNSEMMCSNQPGSDLLEGLRTQVEAHIPVDLETFSDSKWSRAQLLVAGGMPFAVTTQRSRYGWTDYYVEVTVGTLKLDGKTMPEADAKTKAEAITAWLTRLMPLS